MSVCFRCTKQSRGPVELCTECEQTLLGVTEWAAWTEFEEVDVDRDDPVNAIAIHSDEVCFRNSRYQVIARGANTPSGPMVHLSIKRLDKKPIRDWRDLQRIKNELVGPEVEAVEVFPRESHLVDTSNQFHLWCFPEATFPFTFQEGRILTEDSIDGSVQRPWPINQKPQGLQTREEMKSRAMAAIAERRKRHP